MKIIPKKKKKKKEAVFNSFHCSFCSNRQQHLSCSLFCFTIHAFFQYSCCISCIFIEISVGSRLVVTFFRHTLCISIIGPTAVTSPLTHLWSIFLYNNLASTNWSTLLLLLSLFQTSSTFNFIGWRFLLVPPSFIIGPRKFMFLSLWFVSRIYSNLLLLTRKLVL